jgi:hypothetical protein
MEDLQTRLVMARAWNLPPSMISGAVITGLMLPLSGDLFDPPAEAIVSNLLNCAIDAFQKAVP